MKYGQLIIKGKNGKTGKTTTYETRKLIKISRKKDSRRMIAASNIE